MHLNLTSLLQKEGYLSDLPQVTVLIPARNEERCIEKCITSVIEQDYPKIEIVLIDDQSTDCTYDVMSRFVSNERGINVTVLKSGERKPDWTGKINAMYTGYSKIRGEIVLQIDADVILSKDALQKSVRYFIQEKLDLLSLLSTQILVTAGEKIFQTIIPILALSFCRISHVNNADSPKMFMNGQFILYRKSELDKLGGYASISGEVTDDIAIGNLFQANGRKVQLLYGQEYLKTRMYDSIPAIWRGWSKFLYNGIFLKISSVIFALTLISILLILVPTAAIATGIFEFFRHDQRILITFGVLSLITFFSFFQIFNINKMLKGAPAWTFTYPIGATFFCALLLVSTYQIKYGKGIKWKDINYFGKRGRHRISLRNN